MNPVFSLTLASAILLPLAASATTCALPPGTVGIGNYCPAVPAAVAVAPAALPAVVETSLPAPRADSAVALAPAAPAASVTALVVVPQPSVSPVPAAVAAPLPVTASEAVAPQVIPVAAAETTNLRMSVLPGQRLSAALGAWLKAQGITLSWEPAGTLPGRMRDIVFDSAWQASDASLDKTLTDTLQPFGLEAVVIKSASAASAPHTVVVRNSPPTRP